MADLSCDSSVRYKIGSQFAALAGEQTSHSGALFFIKATSVSVFNRKQTDVRDQGRGKDLADSVCQIFADGILQMVSAEFPIVLIRQTLSGNFNMLKKEVKKPHLA